MEPAEVALVVDGQAFQKVCLETWVGVRPPMQTRAPTPGAMYFCVREGVWVSPCACVCARVHREGGNNERILQKMGTCMRAEDMQRKDVQVISPSHQVGLSSGVAVNTLTACSLSHQP